MECTVELVYAGRRARRHGDRGRPTLTADRGGWVVAGLRLVLCHRD